MSLAGGTHRATSLGCIYGEKEINFLQAEEPTQAIFATQLSLETMVIVSQLHAGSAISVPCIKRNSLFSLVRPGKLTI
jgi:hypothetical protein